VANIVDLNKRDFLYKGPIIQILRLPSAILIFVFYLVKVAFDDFYQMNIATTMILSFRHSNRSIRKLRRLRVYYHVVSR